METDETHRQESVRGIEAMARRPCGGSSKNRDGKFFVIYSVCKPEDRRV